MSEAREALSRTIAMAILVDDWGPGDHGEPAEYMHNGGAVIDALSAAGYSIVPTASLPTEEEVEMLRDEAKWFRQQDMPGSAADLCALADRLSTLREGL